MAGRKQSILHCRSIAVLAAGGIYNSAWQQVRLYPLVRGAVQIPVYWDRAWLRGSVVADQDSGAGGFQVHFANEEDFADSWVAYEATLAANVVQGFEVRLKAKFVRVELENGGTAQGTLYLAAFLEDD